MTGALIAACASPRTSIFVAPTENTVQLVSEDTQMSPGKLIYVVNESSVPITVTSIRLTECENIKTRCDFHKLELRIDPRSRRQVLKIEAANPERGFGYRSNFGWRAEGTPITIQPPDA
ncbi:MAG: hypothetical protein ACRENH_12535 [Gemmatimonadaceae bacterium]